MKDSGSFILRNLFFLYQGRRQLMTKKKRDKNKRKNEDQKRGKNC